MCNTKLKSMNLTLQNIYIIRGSYSYVQRVKITYSMIDSSLFTPVSFNGWNFEVCFITPSIPH